MFTVSGIGSSIGCEVFPPLDVSEGDWEVGLVDLTTYNSIPNIESDKNNKFYYGTNKVIVIPEGSYEIEDIESYIVDHLEKGVEFRLKANNNTLKSEIFCSENINFDNDHSIASLLGFEKVILEANKTHVSHNPVNIVRVNVIRVECNLARGSFDNGTEGHIIHEFYPTVAPGYKIVEVPSTIIYLPVNAKKVDNIKVVLRDQNGDLINLRDEIVSLRIHLRKVR